MTDAYDDTGMSPTPLKTQKQTDQTHTGAKALGKGKTTGKVEGADSASLGAARKYGLNEAEILALRTYTAKDYTYINPATANAPGWMLSNNPGATDPKNLFAEGSLHAGVMMEALSKLPVKKGTTYRGARMTQEDFDAKYGDDKPKPGDDKAKPGGDKAKPGGDKPSPAATRPSPAAATSRRRSFRPSA